MAKTGGSQAATRGKSRTAARKARATRRNKSQQNYSVGREIVVTTFGCIGILFGVVFIGAAIAFWYGSQMMLGILNEVAEKDFTNQYERISKYEAFFDGLVDAGYDVIREEPKIDTKPDSSAKFYLWRVQPAGTSEFCIYRWRYDLQSDAVEPSTNPALLLDIEMGYIKRDDAGKYSFYDAGDELAQAIAEENLGMLQLRAYGSVWESDTPPEGPVMAPMVSVDEAEGRESQFMNDLYPKDPDAEEVEGSQDAVDVGGGDASDPAAEGDGSAADGSGGDSSEGSGQSGSEATDVSG
jgi:hypothetical protein